MMTEILQVALALWVLLTWAFYLVVILGNTTDGWETLWVPPACALATVAGIAVITSGLMAAFWAIEVLVGAGQ